MFYKGLNDIVHTYAKKNILQHKEGFKYIRTNTIMHKQYIETAGDLS